MNELLLVLLGAGLVFAGMGCTMLAVWLNSRPYEWERRHKPPAGAIEVTCLGCGVVSHHPQTCTEKLRTIRVPSGPAPGSAPRASPRED